MSTKDIFNKITSLTKECTILKGAYSSKLQTDCTGFLFTVGGSVLRTKSLIDAGFEPTISELLLPHIVMTFGPSLFANTLSPRFKLESKDLIVYLFAFLVSVFGQSNNFLMFFSKEIPYISKFFYLVKLKNSKEDTFLLFSWKITNEMAGMFLGKLILKKKMKISHSDLFSLIFVNVGILYLRIYNMNDYYVILVANIVPLSIKAYEHFSRETKKKSINELLSTPKKSSKRKTSVSARMEKNK